MTTDALDALNEHLTDAAEDAVEDAASIYDMFKTSNDLETSGIELGYGPATIIVARAGGANKRYIRMLAKEFAPYQRQFEMGTLDNALAEEILRKVFAHTVVLGWRDVRGKDKAEIPFTPEACIKLFTELPDLFNDLREQSSKMANFLERELEAASGN